MSRKVISADKTKNLLYWKCPSPRCSGYGTIEISSLKGSEHFCDHCSLNYQLLFIQEDNGQTARIIIKVH